MSKKIGIITYHSAYNFGSMLQALAIQKAVNRIIEDSTILNYRMREQKKFYSMYRTEYGLKTLVFDLMQFPLHKKRLLRAARYEEFMATYMNLSIEYSEPTEMDSIWNEYDIFISGSDQIWNKHSCELERSDWKYMDPYLLEGFQGKKISYASSIANMTEEDLQVIKGKVSNFDYLSVREKESVAALTKLSHKKVTHVCDPTFLLNREEWISLLRLKKQSDKYIVYYSLGGLKKYKNAIKTLLPLAKKMKCKLKVVNPFSYFPYKDTNLEVCADYGPQEFMESIYGAELIVTDSYHGTILSLNLGKNVYSICGKYGSEFRKTDVLRFLGLENRIISDVSDLTEMDLRDIDYSNVDTKIDKFRECGKEYLATTICK